MVHASFVALPTAEVHAVQDGCPDANGMPPERHVSDGDGNPCRHCLTEIALDRPMLILAWRPFPECQPYAEVGPIFLHAERCPRYDGDRGIPPMFLARERLLFRAYDANHRIVYGTGQIARSGELMVLSEQLLVRQEIAYLHIRSVSNGCYQCRIERG